MARKTRVDKRELLRDLPAFEALGDASLEPLLPALRVVEVERRDELFHRRGEGASVHFVVDGCFKAMTTSALGDDVVFEVLGPGDVFGENGFTPKAPRTQTVRAIDTGRVVAIDARDFGDFLQSHPQVSLVLLDQLSRRLRALCEFFEDVHFMNLPQRLAKKLVSLSERFGEPRRAGVRIDLRLSQEEWGDLVGATRESVNKQLKVWTEEGLVQRQQGRLVLTDFPAIERLAHEGDF